MSRLVGEEPSSSVEVDSSSLIDVNRLEALSLSLPEASLALKLVRSIQQERKDNHYLVRVRSADWMPMQIFLNDRVSDIIVIGASDTGSPAEVETAS